MPGTYELWFEGAKIAGPFATNTGLDALPGSYELRVATMANGSATNTTPSISENRVFPVKNEEPSDHV